MVSAFASHDVYAQVAENQKRHCLRRSTWRSSCARCPMPVNRMRIARRMGIEQTTMAHHLAVLTLPPHLEEAFQRGR